MMRDLRLFQPDTMMTVPLIVEMVHRRLAAASQERGLEEELNHKARRRFLRREPEASVSEKLENLKNEIFPEMQIIISGGAHPVSYTHLPAGFLYGKVRRYGG